MELLTVDIEREAEAEMDLSRYNALETVIRPLWKLPACPWHLPCWLPQGCIGAAYGSGLISGVPQTFADYIRICVDGIDVVFVIDARLQAWVHNRVRERIEACQYVRNLVPLARTV